LSKFTTNKQTDQTLHYGFIIINIIVYSMKIHSIIVKYLGTNPSTSHH